MRARAALWFSGAWWLLPVAAVLSVLFADAGFPADGSYPLAGQVLGAQSVVLVAPVVGLAAAWVGGRLRSAGWVARPTVRPAWRVWLARLTPVVLVGWVAVEVSAVRGGVRAGGWALPPPGLAAVDLSQLAAAGAIGYAAGTWLRLPIAAPVAIVVPYVVLAFPPAMEPLWLRNMFGINNGCCLIYQSLSTRAVLASVLTGAALTLLGYGLVHRPVIQPIRPPARAAGAVVVCLALAGAAVIVRGMGPSPVQTRTGTTLCRGNAPSVCVWPEHRAELQTVEPFLVRVRTAAGASGVQLPQVLTESISVPLRWPRTKVQLAPHAGRALLQSSVLYSLFPQPFGRCTGVDSQSPAYFYQDAATITRAWWAAELGLSRGTVAEDAQLAQRVKQVRALPLPRQGELIDAAERAAVSCRPLPTMMQLR